MARPSACDNEAILIAYGSNLTPASFFAGQTTASQAFAGVVKSLQKRGLIVNKISRLWRSKAWPDPNDPAYVNAIIAVETELQPPDLLALLHDLERESGRIRTDQPNLPRVLDLDLIAYGRVIINDFNGLMLPHPRAADRAFVMGPLSDILPHWTHPVLNRTAGELFADSTVGRDAHPLD